MDFGNAFGALGADLAMNILSWMAPVIVGWIGIRLDKLFNKLDEKNILEIEAKHRDALKQAVTTAVESLLTDADDILKDPANNKGVLIEAKEYVKKSVPDAVKKLGAADDIILELVKSKIKETIRRISI